jgi:hypothetical protein
MLRIRIRIRIHRIHMFLGFLDPDPLVMSFPQGGGQGGRNERQIITGRDALLKMSNRVILFFYVQTRWDPVPENQIKGSFINSFIH